MNKPTISSDFTIDDIHKIREWHYEERKRQGKINYKKRIDDVVKNIVSDIPKAKIIHLST